MYSSSSSSVSPRATPAAEEDPNPEDDPKLLTELVLSLVDISQMTKYLIVIGQCQSDDGKLDCDWLIPDRVEAGQSLGHSITDQRLELSGHSPDNFAGVLRC